MWPTRYSALSSCFSIGVTLRHISTRKFHTTHRIYTITHIQSLFEQMQHHFCLCWERELKISEEFPSNKRKFNELLAAAVALVHFVFPSFAWIAVDAALRPRTRLRTYGKNTLITVRSTCIPPPNELRNCYAMMRYRIISHYSAITKLMCLFLSRLLVPFFPAHFRRLVIITNNERSWRGLENESN